MRHEPKHSRLLTFSLIALGTLARLIPHPPNFSPLGAISLFGGARLAGWQAYAVPLMAMILSDGLLTLFRGPQYSAGRVVVYVAFLLSVAIGRLMLRGRTGVGRIAGATFAGSLQFFLVTNFAVWAAARMYPMTLGGLLMCYEAALPFFGWTLAGDLFYAAVLFGLYDFVSRRLPAAASAH